ncbi:MAG: hypothetical protein NDJ92_10455 [Thermoanaerobaculia bacterium]|nr:hypothetical protein [Thermoanaerobaculia bacterium]
MAFPTRLVADASLLLAIAVPQLVWSWRRWADPLVDFGRELYVPWRLAEGEILYRDIAHLNGPVSMTYHATLFRMFGVSYSVIIASNLVVLALISVVLYALFARGSRVAGPVAAGTFLAFFAFGHYTGIGNYSYPSPYAHEATHGLLFVLVALYALDWALRAGRLAGFPLAGIATGLAVVSKAEFALAATAVAATAIVLVPRGRRFRAAAALASAAIVPYVIGVAAFSRYMPVRDAAMSVLGSITLLARTDVGKGIYYTSGMGLDAPLHNVGIATLSAAIFGAGVALAAWSSRRAAQVVTRPAAKLPFYAILAGLSASGLLVGPSSAGRVLTITTLAILAWVVYDAAKTRHDERHEAPALLLFAVLAMALLAKMILFPRIYHYGFVLAMPAGVLLVIALCRLVPQRLDGGGRRVFLTCALAFLCCLALHCLSVSKWRYGMKNVAIGSGGDRIVAYDPRVDPRSAILVNALDWIERNVPREAKLVVVPTGSMINFLTRRRGGHHPSVMPPEQSAFGEERIVRDLKTDAPDFVLLVLSDERGYGVGPFGRDPRFGAMQMAWIERNYRAIGRFGAAQVVGPASGIEVFERSGRQGTK